MALFDRDSALAVFLRFLQRAILLVALIIAGIVIFEFLTTAYRKYGQLDADAYGIFWSRREWLWIHIAGGTLAMLLGPVQFLTQLPRAYPVFHRWTGRCYFVAMLVACAGAAGLIATTHAGLAFKAAFGATALAWLVTGLMGLMAIHGMRPQAHRRWMVRNYLVTLAPITFRAMIRMPGVMELASPAVMIPTLLWLSWVLPLLVHEGGAFAIRLVRSTHAMASPGQSGFGTARERE